MSGQLETELREAFEAASEIAMPPADLADRVRRAARRRAGRALATAAAAAVVLAATAYVAGTLATAHYLPPPRRSAHRLRIPVPPAEYVSALAADGSYIYLATGSAGGVPPYWLSAYYRSTGRLVRHVRVPSQPVALRVGPRGSVWLTFYADQAGGPSGTWLLTADLSRRSAIGLGSSDVLPTGPRTALLAWQRALKLITMPPPGEPGRATARADRSATVDRHYAATGLTSVAGRIAVLEANDFGHRHLAIAGHPRLTFGGGPRDQVSFVAAQGRAVWVTTTTSYGNEAVGPLLRLSAALRPITPRAVQASRILRRSVQVWSAAQTVVVSTEVPGHHLVCFRFDGRMGPVTTIPLDGQASMVAAAGHSLYIVKATNPPVVTFAVVARAIPPACR